MCVCVRMAVCMLLMSSVNDSIRLFLNALVTLMGHSTRESAHSAETDHTLGWHQTHMYQHTHTHIGAHMLHSSNQWCVLSYPFVLFFHYIFGMWQLSTFLTV